MELITKSVDETNQFVSFITLTKSRSRSKDHFSNSVKFKETLTESLNKKQKKLTAKYSNTELVYIKSRLNLELWIHEQLNSLYETDKELVHKQDNEVFDDELIDKLASHVSDAGKMIYLKKLLKDARKPTETVELFIDELINRLKKI